MAYNGDTEQQGEYTEEYQVAYVEQSAEYQELIGLGIDEQVARELDELFQAGKHIHCLKLILSLANSGFEDDTFTIIELSRTVHIHNFIPVQCSWQ